MITKAAARAKAVKVLQNGHFVRSVDVGEKGGVYVRCPDCREDVEHVWSPLDRKTPTAMLRDRLVEHFTDYCEGAKR